MISGGDLGTPSAGVVTNLTGTASININGTVGATTANAGTFSSTVHKGATSGTVTITAPAVAGTQSYTLPTAVPAANGYALTSTTAGVMSWAANSATPGGSTTQVQYNNAGAFGGISGFTTDGTRVTASTTIAVGGATPSTSGAGITFPVTQSASSSAKTLDDYEEGTWTPSLGGTATYTTQVGYYTKIGRQVTLWGHLQVLVIGTGSTSLISGNPFTPSASAGSAYNPGSVYWSSLAISETNVIVVTQEGSGTIWFCGRATSATTIDNQIAIFGNSAVVRFSLTYNI